MKKLLLMIMLVYMFTGMAISSCKKDKEEPPPPPTTGDLSGKITDKQTQAALADARIIIFNANTNAPAGAVAVSDATGNYKLTLDPGKYYVKIYRQGYEPVPLNDAGIIPFEINAGDNLTQNYQLNALADASALGWISGKVLSDGIGLSGVLVVAENSIKGYSAVSTGDGSYIIYNVPAGSWKINAWKQNFNGTEKQVSVTANQQTPNIDIIMTEGGTGSVSGKISYLSTTNVEVDVSLVHPLTKETIPGLSTKTSAYTYAINGIPAGTYWARASYENDTKVMDPDWLLKFGQPTLTINGNAATLDFSVTGALGLSSPTNELSSVKPVDASATPAFVWQPYSSATHYVIEVVDARGEVIWGGISGTGNNAVRNVVVPKTQLSVTYNFDGAAKEALKPGEIYRWRVYASKDENSTLGWKLISASEDQVGLIKITQ